VLLQLAAGGFEGRAGFCNTYNAGSRMDLMDDGRKGRGQEAPPTDDDRRIQGYLAGDPATFDEVDSWIRSELRLHYAGLRRDHDDLLQTVHGRLLDSLRAGRFEGRSALRTYVGGIVHRTAIVWLRRRYRERLFTDSHPEELARSPDNPYRDVEVRDERRRLWQVLLSMPASCRELWKLVFVDGLTYEEVGGQLAVPSGTIKSRMWYCRRKAVTALKRLVR
jgi:RNA polymerase sigma-70 factor (ECF subfamily)